MRKKLVSLLLCAAMIFAQSSVVFAAEQEECVNAEAAFTFVKDGSETAVDSITDAVASMESGNQATITLNSDINLRDGVEAGDERLTSNPSDYYLRLSGGELTIDLNGHKLMGGGVNVDADRFAEDWTQPAKHEEYRIRDLDYFIGVIGEGTVLHIVDSSPAKGGVVEGIADVWQNFLDRSIIAAKGGKVDIGEGVTVKGIKVVSVYGATLEAKGDILAKQEAVYLEDASFTSTGNKITVYNDYDENSEYYSTTIRAVAIAVTNACSVSLNSVKVDVDSWNKVSKCSGNLLGIYSYGGSNKQMQDASLTIIDSSISVTTRATATAYGLLCSYISPKNVVIKNSNIDVNVTEDAENVGGEAVQIVQCSNCDVVIDSLNATVTSHKKGSGGHIIVISESDNAENTSNIIKNSKFKFISGGNPSATQDGCIWAVSGGNYKDCEITVDSESRRIAAVGQGNDTTLDNCKIKATSTSTISDAYVWGLDGSVLDGKINLLKGTEIKVSAKSSKVKKKIYGEIGSSLSGLEKIVIPEGLYLVDSKNNKVSELKKLANLSYVLVTDGSIAPGSSDEPSSGETALSKCTFTWDDTNSSTAPKLTYDASEQKPAFTIKDKNGKTLVDGTDFDAEYIPVKRGKTLADAGNFKLKITAKSGSGYKGTLIKKYKIKPCSISQAASAGYLVVNTTNSESLVYDPAGVKPQYEVTYRGTLLESPASYKAIFTGRRAAGTGDVAKPKSQLIKLTGRGNFTGKLSIPYTVMKRSISDNAVSVSAKDVLYKSQPGKFMVKPVLKQGRKKLKLNKDYTIEKYVDARTGAELTAESVPEKGTLVKIIIKAKGEDGEGNYNSSTSVIYKVAETLLNKAVVSLVDGATLTYGETVITPEMLEVKATRSGDALAADQYSVAYNYYLKGSKKMVEITVSGAEDSLYGGSRTVKLRVQ